MMKTPVIFIIFNRPDTTRQVFETIRQARPSKLLLVADGPRYSHPNDPALCKQVRNMVMEGIDWPCELLTCFSDNNLDRDPRIISGLTWAFEQVEQAIILEDDCLPDNSFFHFCDELLERYKDDPRIMSICGSNYLPKFNEHYPYSYYFSRIPIVWGWATWRRAWGFYGKKIEKSTEELNEYLKEYFGEWPEIYDYAVAMLKLCRNQGNLSWDYFWAFIVMFHKSFHIIPSKNLVSNIGFSSEATYTRNTQSELANIHRHRMEFPLQHPLEICDNKTADVETMRAMLRHIQLCNEDFYKFFQI
jgi:hypothetical protein